ncbi:NLR family, CARD domain containing 5 [Megalops cyprinoides]|uniref:NLR family, CARD domain containing 5 n=1 Tax=Megalops cyprinoides TaxID=118141 RepID=UPI00186542E4|nr:NLR family, CARD domain containing 5 [Megalops cyprinoides]
MVKWRRLQMERVDMEADVFAVLDEYRSALIEILHSQPDRLQAMYRLAGAETSRRLVGVADLRERVSLLVDHFRNSGRATCRRFVEMVSMECEGLPMALESLLLFVAGDPRCPAAEETPDYIGGYSRTVRDVLQQKCQRVTCGLAGAVRLDEARVSLRHRALPRRAGSLEGEEPGVERVITVESLLSSLHNARLTVLLGPAGSGKTVLMHCAGQRWAQGHLPAFQLLYLLEFRQLNLLTRPLSLSQLLFHFFPPSAHSEEQQEGEAVLSFILANPQKVCVIFDGYDEVSSRFAPETPSTAWEPRQALPVLELFSGLCSGRILPGCCVLVTCRPRDTADLPDSALEGELLGFDRRQVEEYAERYFRGKAHGLQAAAHLLASRHILTMCYVPALCHLCCVCLDYLFSRGPRPPSLLPTTVTQVYLQILNAFLSRAPAGGAVGGAVSPLQQHRAELRGLCQLAMQGLEISSIVFPTQHVPGTLLDFAMRTGLLSQFEMRLSDGSQGNGCAFMHLAMQEFLAALHLMTSEGVTEPQLRKKLNLKTRWTSRTDPKTVFTDTLHLYLCGLAAPTCTPHLVHLAGGRAEGQVQRRQDVVLKVLQGFSSSAHLTGPKLVELSRCTHETQDVRLAKAVGSRPCFELRNIRLAPVDMDALAFVISAAGRGVGLDIAGCSMELECLQALPSFQHIDYLIFRSRKYDDAFAEVLSGVLPSLPALKRLEFICGNLTEVGAAKLARAVQSCPQITQLSLSDNTLRDGGVREVAEVLPQMTSLCSLSLGKNSCTLDGVFTLLEKMATCLRIQTVHIDGQREMSEMSVLFSQGSESLSCAQEDSPSTHRPGRTVSLLNCSLTAAKLDKLCKILAGCPGLSVVDLSGSEWKDEALQVLADSLQTLGISREISMNRITVSLDELLVLTRSLTTCPEVVEVDIRLQDPTKVCLLFAGETQRQPPGMKAANPVVWKKLRLMACSLRPPDLDRVCETLRGCPALTLLDVSGNALGDSGLRKLLDLLPQLSAIQEINASENAVTMEGVVHLATALCTCRNMSEIEVSHGGKKKLILKFRCSKRVQSGESLEVTTSQKNGLQLYKKLSLTHSDIQPARMDQLCGRLAQCPGMLELSFSHGSLGEASIQKLLKRIPGMVALQLLDVSHVQMSTDGVLLLVRSLIDCQRVKAVELRPQGEAFIKFVQVKAEYATCRVTQYHLTQRNVEKLARILQECSHLSHLDLSGNLLRDEGVKRFVEFLPKLRISSSVNLNDNSLTQTGALYLVSSISVCERVVSVEVSLGTVEKSFIRFLEDEDNGKTLSLRECHFGVEHLQKLADILQDCPLLVKLEISNNGLSADVIEDLLKVMMSLCLMVYCPIRIEESWIKEEAAVRLVCSCLDVNSNITEIRVNQMTANITLEKTAALRSVNLASVRYAPRSDCADESCLVIIYISVPLTQPLPLPVSLSLVDCALQGQNLSFLLSVSQNCPLLQELDLSRNSIGKEGMEFISAALPGFPNLRTLRLGLKQVSEDGVGILMEGVAHCRSLESLSVPRHAITEEAAVALGGTLPKLQHLRAIDLSGCSILSGAGSHDLLRGLGQCHAVEELRLDSLLLNAEATACLAGELKGMASVRRLLLNKVTMATGSSEEGRRAILSLPGSLGGFHGMEELELDEVRMGEGGVLQLVKHLPSWTRLRRISLSENCVSDAAGQRLAASLHHCTALEELRLSRNALGDASAAQLGVVLPVLTRLKVLDLSENRIGTEGAEKLTESLVQMSSLRKLHLISIGTAELTGLAESLQHCVCAEEVSLAWNDCGDEVALKMAQVLPRCTKLKRLDLECNKISSAGASALAESLRSCPSIEVIRLWKNSVSYDEAQRLHSREPRLNFSST